jgi:hypothetical protein
VCGKGIEEAQDRLKISKDDAPSKILWPPQHFDIYCIIILRNPRGIF